MEPVPDISIFANMPNSSALEWDFLSHTFPNFAYQFSSSAPAIDSPPILYTTTPTTVPYKGQLLHLDPIRPRYTTYTFSDPPSSEHYPASFDTFASSLKITPPTAVQGFPSISPRTTSFRHTHQPNRPCLSVPPRRELDRRQQLYRSRLQNHLWPQVCADWDHVFGPLRGDNRCIVCNRWFTNAEKAVFLY